MVRRLGDLLVAEGLVKEEQLRQALSEQKGKTDKLGSILVRLGFISEEQLIGFLSRQYGIPSITLTNLDIDGETLRLVPSTSRRSTRCSRSSGSAAPSRWRCRTRPTSSRWTTSPS
jgi:hypothetical protein